MNRIHSPFLFIEPNNEIYGLNIVTQLLENQIERWNHTFHLRNIKGLEKFSWNRRMLTLFSYLWKSDTEGFKWEKNLKVLKNPILNQNILSSNISASLDMKRFTVFRLTLYLLVPLCFFDLCEKLTRPKGLYFFHFKSY